MPTSYIFFLTTTTILVRVDARSMLVKDKVCYAPKLHPEQLITFHLDLPQEDPELSYYACHITLLSANIL